MVPRSSWLIPGSPDTPAREYVEEIERVFEPFFTTKFVGRGLGMSATLGILHGHKAAIEISSEVGKGTTIEVLFPGDRACSP